jgi:hypothetical protein
VSLPHSLSSPVIIACVRFVPRTVPSSSASSPRSWSWLLLGFGFWLLASFFSSFSFLLVLLHASALGFCLGCWLLAFQLLGARALGFCLGVWLLVSLLLLSCALVRLAFGFCLVFWLLAFAKYIAKSFAKSFV